MPGTSRYDDHISISYIIFIANDTLPFPAFKPEKLINADMNFFTEFFPFFQGHQYKLKMFICV